LSQTPEAILLLSCTVVLLKRNCFLSNSSLELPSTYVWPAAAVAIPGGKGKLTTPCANALSGAHWGAQPFSKVKHLLELD